MDRNSARKPNRFILSNVGNKPKKRNDNNTMTMKFLLHKDKEENGKPSPQKQECGCPSLQPSLRSHTHAFFADPLTANNES
jgi:hypothetical protein